MMKDKQKQTSSKQISSIFQSIPLIRKYPSDHIWIDYDREADFQSIPLIRKYPSDHIWIDYDREADVLYMSFEKPQSATDSVLQNDVLIRKRNNRIIGLTILNASKFRKE